MAANRTLVKSYWFDQWCWWPACL